MLTLDVSDIDIYTLLRALWKNSKPACFFAMIQVAAPEEPSNEEIDNIFAESLRFMKEGCIDYLAGRCIKTNFKDLTKVNPEQYNRCNGNGAFERIVHELWVTQARN
ncbi:Hypothetical protein HVR_LOCUS962 [uncultured virus]|nr:Hypothetical protein HVR_LOCUS962 [uncultured virus]